MHEKRPTNITPASNVFVASVCSAKKVLRDYSLGRCGALGRSLLAVTFVETIDSARRVNQFLFSSKERMTSGANFHVQVSLAGGARIKCLATGTGNGYFGVFRMDSR